MKKSKVDMNAGGEVEVITSKRVEDSASENVEQIQSLSKEINASNLTSRGGNDSIIPGNASTQ